MRLSRQRATLIDNLRAYGPMTVDAMMTRTGGGKRNTQRLIRGLVEEKAVSLSGDTLHLTPTGYMAVGSFPPKQEAAHE